MPHTLRAASAPVDRSRGRTPWRAILGAGLALALAGCAQQGGTSAPPVAGQPTQARTPAPAAGGSVGRGETARVAVLAPLSSSNPQAAAAGRAVVAGARLAAAEQGGGLIALTVKDTGGDATTAAVAAREAAAEGADLILGPLFGANAQVVGQAAREAGLNVISFSNTPSAAGGNVWLAGLLASDEAERALRHAASRGAFGVGVYHPEDAAGVVARDAAIRAGRGAGVSVSPTLGYPRSFEGIQNTSADYAESHRISGATAVLLPDRGQGLQAAASFLAFHGLTSRDTLFLGFAEWENPAILSESALIGGRFAAPDPGYMAAFSARYQSANGAPPHELSWIGYDAASAAAGMVRRARERGDDTPFDAGDLTSPSGFQGAAGRIRFTPDGFNRRELAILEVTPSGFIPLEPAPGSPSLIAPPAEAADPDAAAGAGTEAGAGTGSGAETGAEPASGAPGPVSAAARDGSRA
ncbi:MAG: penicillin-binding protein activator [Pseudomonadota bacterium]